MTRTNLLSLLVLVCLLIAGLNPVYANEPSRMAATADNLIVNPDAEAGTGGNGEVVPVPGWTVQGNFTVVLYSAGGGFPDANTPGPAERGANFFAGGPNAPTSSASQTIDLSGYAAAIDTGRQAYTLSGYFGGYSNHPDNTTLTVTFKDSTDLSLGSATIGPVTNDERGNLTSFFNRAINGLVPAQSRKVEVTLLMTRYMGAYNDGYADNLFLGLGSVSGGVISGTVYNDSPVAGNEVKGAFIEACLADGACQVTTSNSDGSYWFINLAAGQYRLRFFPPGGNNRLIGLLGPLTLVADSALLDKNVTLFQPTTTPAGTTITPVNSISNGVAVVYWMSPLTLTTTGCSSGAASYELFYQGAVIRSGTMLESPPGTYTATIAPVYPSHGNAQVLITLQCPGSDPVLILFSIWIDPSGRVVNTFGEPVAGATVTLYRSDAISGPFDIVISGSAIMSPGNRANPMQTDSGGLFGWDVIAGYYVVRAEKSGCVAPNDHAQLYTQTDSMTIPPPVSDLRLALYCGEGVRVYLPAIKR